MKHSILLLGFAIWLPFIGFAQTEKEVASTIKKVTVFTQGAQIEMEASVALTQGKMVLKFTGLSPYINTESIRINGDGSFTILNVQHQNDYLNQLDKNKEIEALKRQIEDFQYKIEDEETGLKIIKEKIDFLNVNKVITGKEASVNPETYKALNAIYGSNIEALNLEVLKKQRLINQYKKEISKLNSQLNSLNSRSDLPSGTIFVTIDAKQTITSKLSFSFLVDHAEWYPTYDIRFNGVNKPLQITHKANISQNTGIDWKDVKLVLSTAKTNLSAQIPEYYPYYLQFYYPEISKSLQGKVLGVTVEDDLIVNEDADEPTIKIRGMSTLDAQNPLYIVDGVAMDDISNLIYDDIDNVEVLKDASATAIYGSKGANGVVVVTTKKNKQKSSIPMTITSKRETSNEFMVDDVQTILSNQKTTTVSYREANLEASFEYHSIPKLSENVYLIAKINHWYDADLLDGEVNIYLENSYVGKSTINTQQFNDTLDVSFGVDNNISIKRDKLTDYSESQFVGSTLKQSIGYKLTIRNNKAYAVTTKIIDQIPVSTTKEIQVEAVELSGGKLDANTGKVEWEIALNPNETKELMIKYWVKYPKDKNVKVE